MRKILVVEDGVIVGLREYTKEEAVRFILESVDVSDCISVPKYVEELIESTLASFGERLRMAFLEGAEAERDRTKAEEELGEEVELVVPYGRI